MKKEKIKLPLCIKNNLTIRKLNNKIIDNEFLHVRGVTSNKHKSYFFIINKFYKSSIRLF